MAVQAINMAYRRIAFGLRSMATSNMRRQHRQFHVASVATVGSLAVARPFAVLVSSMDFVGSHAIDQFAKKLMDAGCCEFCCVGPQAEQLHDMLDWSIEDSQAMHVVTTWHAESVDACEYFLFSSGGGTSLLVALIEGHPDLVSSLQSIAEN